MHKPWYLPGFLHSDSIHQTDNTHTQQPALSNRGHSEDCYEALIEHLRNCLGRLVFCHHSQGVPREMVCHHKDVFHHRGLIQLHRGLNAGVVKMHKLQRSICSNRTQGSPWHFSLVRLTVQASPYYSSAILSHHRPPEPLLCEGQGLLLTLVSGIPMYPVERHAALSHRDDEHQHSLGLAFRGHVDVHQTLIQDETVADAEEHLALFCLGFCSQALLEESVPSRWQHTLPEAKPFMACS